MLIELARLLSKQESRIGVDIILFDAEDYGNPDGDGSSMTSSWCIGLSIGATTTHK